VRRRTAKRQDLLFGDTELSEQVSVTHFEKYLFLNDEYYDFIRQTFNKMT